MLPFLKLLKCLGYWVGTTQVWARLLTITVRKTAQAGSAKHSAGILALKIPTKADHRSYFPDGED